MKERQELCGCITQEMFIAFARGELLPADEADILAHIARCDACAEQFAKVMEQEIQVTPPVDLCSQIMEQTVGKNGTEIRNIEVKQRRKMLFGWQNFWGYTARVVCGVAVALVIIFYMPTDLSASRNDMQIQHAEERMELARQRDLETEKRRVDEGSRREERASRNTSIISAWLNRVSGAIGDNLSNVFMKEEEG